MKELEQARSERALYDAAPSEERRQHNGIGNWAAAKLGVTVNSASKRNRLFMAGDIAMPLWRAIEHDRMTLTTAVDLLMRAQSQSESVESVIQEWRTTGYAVTDERGNVSRRLPARAKAKAVKIQPLSDKPGRQRVREAFASWASNAAPEILDEAMTELDALMESTHNRIYQRARRRAAIIPRTAIVNACHTLGIRIPKPGQPVDIKNARKAQRNMLRAAHPDVVGDNSQHGVFQSINDAFSILQLYNDQLNVKTEEPNGHGIATPQNDASGDQDA